MLPALIKRAGRTGFAQAVRLIERSARDARGPPGIREVGADTRYDDEPIRFSASPRMTTVAIDIAAAEQSGTVPVKLTANILGLAGATPSLPAYYSETQLQRRRLRDHSFTDFLNLFNHRALSFFYRAARKYDRAIAYEREPVRGSDQVTRLLLALGGIGVESLHDRLVTDDQVLAPLAAQIGGGRRSAAAVATVLTEASGMPVRIRQAQPTWMAVPPSEQTRLGAPLGSGHAATLGEAAMLGAAVLDVQHHFTVEVGPLGYHEFLDFCRSDGPRRRLAELTCLASGLPYRARVRALVEAAALPALRLGVAEMPALLGQTTWMRPESGGRQVLDDCSLPLNLGPAQKNQVERESSLR